MWFRNLQLYRLTQPFDLGPEALAERLEDGRFRPCGSLEMSSYGWVSPLGRQGETLTHAAGGNILLCARREDKVLPAAVVKELLAERVAEIEEREMRKPGRKEREGLREELLQDLLPRAFTRSSYTHAYLAPRSGWLVVDAASPKRAEDLNSLLRSCLGSLPSTLPAVRESPAAVMTGWLAGEAVPDDLVLGDECELRDPSEDGSIVRCKRQDLGAEEIRAHLEAGKRVSRLAVSWDERLSCVLGEDLIVRRLRFEDVVQDQAARDPAEDPVARLDADFALMTLELDRFLPRWLALFGGEDREAYSAAGRAA